MQEQQKISKRTNTHSYVSKKENAQKPFKSCSASSTTCSKERLCKSFYLKTLDISQKRIVTYYATRNVDIGLY